MTVISSSAPCAAIPLVRARPEYLNPDPWHRVLTLHTHRILPAFPSYCNTDSPTPKTCNQLAVTTENKARERPVAGIFLPLAIA
jgi:hypothetical protein